MPIQDIIILCKKNPESPNRNFAFGKYFSNSDIDNTVYCTEDCKTPCEFKKTIQKWK